MADLQKLFVLVGGDKAQAQAFKTKYVGTADHSYDNKICFLEGTGEIFTKGKIYGMSTDQASKLSAIIASVGLNADGTLPNWDEVAGSIKEGATTNYIASAASIIAAVIALDAKAKALQDELDAEQTKVAASKTLDENYEFTGKLVYVPAATTPEGAITKAAHIALVDETGAELAESSIDVSKIIGNSILKSSAYDKESGKLTLVFDNGAGGTQPIEVNLAEMLDINDVKIDDDSKSYIDVVLTSAENSQAVFSIKVSKMADAALTGLADAADVKAYVDAQVAGKNVTANGDTNYIEATASDNNVSVSAKIGKIEYTSEGGFVGETGLADSAATVTAVKGYVGAEIAKEATARDTAITGAINGLNKTSSTVDGTNVHVTYKEEKGIVTIESVAADYATVSRTNTTSAEGAPKTDAAISVTEGTKLVIGSDLEKVAAYAADLKTEEAHRVDKKIAGLGGTATSGDVAGISTQVTTAGGEVKTVVVTVADNNVTASIGENGVRNLSADSATDVIKGSAIAAIKTYVDGVVSDNSTKLGISAVGDDYITAGVDSTNNKKINVSADVQVLSVGKVGQADSTLTGVEKSLVDGKDVADKVSSFVNARIPEEIAKLKKDSTPVGDGNVQVTYSEANGIVTISGVSEKYATVTYTPASGDVAANLTVTEGTEGQLVKGSDIASLKSYVDAVVTGLDSDITKSDTSNFVTVKTVIADGKLADTSSVAVTYASHAAASGKYGDGVATGAFVNSVLGDLWETYTA